MQARITGDYGYVDNQHDSAQALRDVLQYMKNRPIIWPEMLVGPLGPYLHAGPAHH